MTTRLWNFIRVLAIALTIIGMQPASAQQTLRRGVAINANMGGFIQYLPPGYTSSGQAPIIIFLHGAGELGNGDGDLSQLLIYGPPKEVASGRFANNPYIIISPQFRNYPTIEDVATLVDYCLANYGVDQNRIYLTGLSMGGGIAWRYASRDLATARKLAAFVPVCGAQYPYDPAGPRFIAQANLPVYATHNTSDNVVDYVNSTTWVNLINQAPAPNPPAKLLTNPGNSTGHDAWTATYDTRNLFFDGKNIFDWMAQYSRGTSSLPVKLSSYTVSAFGAKVTVKWTSSFESNNDHYTVERSIDGINFTKLGDIKATNIQTGSEYSFEDPAAPVGNDYYRLTQTDIDGKVTTFDVKKVVVGKTVSGDVRIFPNPVVNQLTLELQNETRGKFSVQILTSTGKLIRTIDFVKRNNFHQQIIALNDLTPGLYVVQVKGEGYSYSQSFIKK